MSENNENQINQNEEFDGEDIFYSCIGLDETDRPKAAFSLNIGTFDVSNNIKNVNISKEYYNPFINITRLGDNVMIDFTFSSRTDTELRVMWSLLTKYGKDLEEAIHSNSGIVPTCELNIVPLKFSGHYYVAAISPEYYVLQPEHPTGEINTIRIVFKDDSVGLLETAAVDENGLIAELERERMEREFIEQAYEQQQEENAEYQEDRNAKIEELRRNGQL